ncbi:hypothetical protein COB55_04110 [Candidatus Wolfebacteria bacterium]|nr:MAG: hypothetical protein COB55_04110 [Candidatus Wolfebacteria bacterium]
MTTNSNQARRNNYAIRNSRQTGRQKVLMFLKSRGATGATDEEVSYALDLDPSTARPRRNELVQMGLAISSGTRLTKANRKATVWVSN